MNVNKEKYLAVRRGRGRARANETNFYQTVRDGKRGQPGRNDKMDDIIRPDGSTEAPTVGSSRHWSSTIITNSQKMIITGDVITRDRSRQPWQIFGSAGNNGPLGEGASVLSILGLHGSSDLTRSDDCRTWSDPDSRDIPARSPHFLDIPGTFEATCGSTTRPSEWTDEQIWVPREEQAQEWQPEEDQTREASPAASQWPPTSDWHPESSNSSEWRQPPPSVPQPESFSSDPQPLRDNIFATPLSKAAPKTKASVWSTIQKTRIPRPTSSLKKTPSKYEDMFSTPSSRQYTSLPPSSEHSFLEPSLTKSPVSGRPSLSRTSVTTPMSTSGSADPNVYVVLALTEGRGVAVGEVGIAVINIKSPTLVLSQMSDCQTYQNTIRKIHIFSPNELVVPDTIASNPTGSKMYSTLVDRFPTTKIVAVKRKFYSNDEGIAGIRKYCIKELASVEIVVLRKFYALSAAAALIKYVEHEHNVVFNKNSLPIVYEPASGATCIDVETAKRLELVLGNVTNANPEKYSLLGLVNHCRTIGGKRKLRTLLLQPMTSESAIQKRLDIVSHLVQDSILLHTIQTCLSKFGNVEKLLWLCTKTPNFKNEQKTSIDLNNFVLILKNTIENIPQLIEVLRGGQHEYFIKIKEILSDPRLNLMKTRISETIHDDAKVGKNSSVSEMTRCFAIKEGINGLLDVARGAYSQLISMIQDEADTLAEEHKLPIKVSVSSDRGFHLMMSLSKNQNLDLAQLPESFDLVKKKGNSIRFTTTSVFNYNVRIQRTVQEIQLTSNVIMFELIEELREHVVCLYRLCERISELDVICSLAQVSSSTNYIRPLFGSELKVIAGRHPILDFLEPTTPIPNDTYASPDKNFNIITGPNMSGKTIYVLQVALLQILAQIGCFVPAESAFFRITDHIIIRKGYGDSIECNASSFSLEMKELNYISQSLTPSSLVIIDEICPGTNHDEGISLAWGWCELLLLSKAFVFLTTHYLYLSNLSNIFTNVSNYQMECIEREQGDFGGLTYTHRILPGVTSIANYGIRLMKCSNLPSELKAQVVDIARKLQVKRSALMPVAKPIDPEVVRRMDKIEKLERFMSNLYELSKTDQFTLEMVEKLQAMAAEDILEKELPEVNQEKVDEVRNESEVADNVQYEETEDVEMVSPPPLTNEPPESVVQPTPLHSPFYGVPRLVPYDYSEQQDDLERQPTPQLDLPTTLDLIPGEIGPEQPIVNLTDDFPQAHLFPASRAKRALFPNEPTQSKKIVTFHIRSTQ